MGYCCLQVVAEVHVRRFPGPRTTPAKVNYHTNSPNRIYIYIYIALFYESPNFTLYTYIYIYIHTHTHTHIYIYIYIYIYIVKHFGL